MRRAESFSWLEQRHRKRPGHDNTPRIILAKCDWGGEVWEPGTHLEANQEGAQGAGNCISSEKQWQRCGLFDRAGCRTNRTVEGFGLGLSLAGEGDPSLTLLSLPCSNIIVFPRELQQALVPWQCTPCQQPQHSPEQLQSCNELIRLQLFRVRRGDMARSLGTGGLGRKAEGL